MDTQTQTNGTVAPPTPPLWTLPPQSPTFGNLAAALAAAQGDFHAASKDRTANVKSDKGSYSYNYANFASIMEAVREPLAKAKLAITCRVKTDVKGATAIAILMHASGEWLCGEPIFVERNASTPQATGSAIEYARKYAVRTLLNIATDEEDDDGQTAAGNGGYQRSNGRVSAPPPPPTEPTMSAVELEAEILHIREHIEAAQDLKALASLVERIMRLPAEARANMRKLYGAKQSELKGGPPSSAPALSDASKNLKLEMQAAVDAGDGAALIKLAAKVKEAPSAEQADLQEFYTGSKEALKKKGAKQ